MYKDQSKCHSDSFIEKNQKNPIYTNIVDLIYIFSMNSNKTLNKLVRFLEEKIVIYIIFKLICFSKNLVATATPSVVRNMN